MGYSPPGHKESDMTERALSLKDIKITSSFHGSEIKLICSSTGRFGPILVILVNRYF